APDAVRRLALPEALGERRTVVGRVRVGPDDPDGAFRVPLTDPAGRGVRGHAAAHDQVVVARHRRLLISGITLLSSMPRGPAPAGRRRVPRSRHAARETAARLDGPGPAVLRSVPRGGRMRPRGRAR